MTDQSCTCLHYGGSTTKEYNHHYKNGVGECSMCDCNKYNHSHNL